MLSLFKNKMKSQLGQEPSKDEQINSFVRNESIVNDSINGIQAANNLTLASRPNTSNDLGFDLKSNIIMIKPPESASLNFDSNRMND
jgi:hypothetical protein